VILTPVETSYSSAAVSFLPNPLRARVHPGPKAFAGESLTFSSNPTLHIRTQSLLGRQAEVRFAPAWLGWQFSDGPRKQGTAITRSFDAEGQYQAWAIANYFVSYRILGESNWQAVPGQVSILSNVIKLNVKVKLPEATPSPSARPLLVGDTCDSNPRNWGCRR
jgi:hypothetical protein